MKNTYTPILLRSCNTRPVRGLSFDVQSVNTSASEHYNVEQQDIVTTQLRDALLRYYALQCLF